MSSQACFSDRPLPYELREELKKEGWDLFRQAQSLYSKRNILMNFIIKAHYWRAREEIESKRYPKKALKMIFSTHYFPGYEMDIDHYTPHWLFSQRNQPFMSKEIYETCKEWYQPKRSRFLPDGMTIYQLPENLHQNSVANLIL